MWDWKIEGASLWLSQSGNRFRVVRACNTKLCVAVTEGFCVANSHFRHSNVIVSPVSFLRLASAGVSRETDEIRLTVLGFQGKLVRPVLELRKIDGPPPRTGWLVAGWLAYKVGATAAEQ